jgi:hypothetical protein
MYHTRQAVYHVIYITVLNCRHISPVYALITFTKLSSEILPEMMILSDGES